jgi:DNA-binding NarL/FixJ family response regulator
VAGSAAPTLRSRRKGFADPVAVHIAVVEPLPMFRQGIATVLTEARYAVETPADVVAWVRQRAGTLVLLTVVSERDWDLLGRLCAGTEVIPVIALLDDVAAGARAVRAGAQSVLPRDITDVTLRRTVAATIEGQAVMPAAVVTALAAHSPTAAATPSAEQLSWLRQLATGSTVGQLADEVGYSERAMFRLLQALYRQIGVATRLQAIMHAKESGWL